MIHYPTNRTDPARAKSITLAIIVCLIMFWAGCSPALLIEESADLVGQPVQAPWPRIGSDLTPDPALLFGQLPNGIRYILMENREPVNRVSMHLNVQAGSLNELAGEEGTAHYLEHMLFNGSTNFKPGELVKYFQRIGMQFGPDANAHTGFEETVYDVLLADNSAQSIAEGLMVLSDYAQGALLLESEVDRERGIILSEKRTRDSVAYRTWVSKVKFEMPATLIPDRLPIGTREAIVAADSTSLRNFYDAWYRPENMVVVIVGDIQPEAVAQKIEETFASVKARGEERRLPDFGSIYHEGVKSFYHFEGEAENTSVSIETLHRAEPFTDTVAYRHKRFVDDLANRMLQNRLDARIGKQGTPYTSGSAGAGVFLKKITYADISAQCSPENWDATLVALETLLRQTLLFGFEAAELERVRKDYQAEFDQAVKNAPTRRSPALARHIIRKLNAKEVVLAPLQKKQLYAPILEKTTLAEVIAALRDIWSVDHRLVLVTGNADLRANGETPTQAITDLYTRSHATALERPPLAAKVIFPYFEVPAEPGSVEKTTVIKDLDLLQTDFANGVRVNLKPTDFEAHQVAVTVSFGKGRSSEPRELAGLGPLAESVVNESGLGALDRDSVDRALAGKNLGVGFNVKEDRFTFSGHCATGDLETLLQLLYAHLSDPGFRPDAFLFSQEKFSQRYLKLEKSVNGALTLAGLRFLAGGDGRFGWPGKQALASLTLEDVTRWIAPVIRTAPIEVSVVGDFEMQAVQALTARYFGNLPARAGDASVDPTGYGALPAFPRGQTLDLKIDTRLPKGLVVVAYPTTDIWNIQRTRRLEILAEIISERLRVGVREELGAAYSTAAFNRPGRAYEGYGALLTYVQVAPDKVPEIRTAVRQIITTLVAGGITADELKRALDPTLSGIRDNRRRNQYWLNTVLAGSRQRPDQLQWSREILEDYAAITVSEIESLARLYLVDTHAAEILITTGDNS